MTSPSSREGDRIGQVWFLAEACCDSMTAYFGWGTSVLDLAGNKIKALPIPRARSRPAEGCAPASRDRCPRCEDSGSEVFFRAPSCIGERRRRLEAQRTEASDQVLPFDWSNGRHSSDFADLKALAVNVRNRGVIGNAEEHPSLQHAPPTPPGRLRGSWHSPRRPGWQECRHRTTRHPRQSRSGPGAWPARIYEVSMAQLSH